MTANAHVGHDDWNERLELAQQMIPLIHQLHRNNNVVTTIFGRPLVGQTDIDIIKSHRYGRRIAAESAPELGRQRGVEIFTRQDGELIALFGDKWKLAFIEKEHPELTMETLVAD